jgi:hypothetical protein
VYRAAFLLVLSPLLAQKDEPRSKAADYPVHVSVPGMEIAAEYLLHSIPTTHGFYVANLYLVVDVGIFPSSGETIKVSNGQFRLRVNHGKFDLIADTPGTVAGSLKYPDWEQQRNLSAQAGPVIIGAPPNVGRFPGDGRDHPPVSASGSGRTRSERTGEGSSSDDGRIDKRRSLAGVALQEAAERLRVFLPLRWKNEIHPFAGAALRRWSRPAEGNHPALLTPEGFPAIFS